MTSSDSHCGKPAVPLQIESVVVTGTFAPIAAQDIDRSVMVIDTTISFHDLDLPLPTGSIQRIEILPGAGSTIYGSDAVGGAVNFITGPPLYSSAQVGAAVGNFGVNQETMSAGFVATRVDEQLNVARDFSSGFMSDRDYRTLTIFSNSGIHTALGRSLVMLGYGDPEASNRRG